MASPKCGSLIIVLVVCALTLSVNAHSSYGRLRTQGEVEQQDQLAMQEDWRLLRRLGRSFRRAARSVRDVIRNPSRLTSRVIQGFSTPKMQALCRQDGSTFYHGWKYGECKDGKSKLTGQLRKGGPWKLVAEQECQSQQKALENIAMCVFTTPDGKKLPYNGPSNPRPTAALTKWLFFPGTKKSPNELFWNAGKIHDLCYSYAHATYGDSRKQCDDEFRGILRKICDLRTRKGQNDHKNCYRLAEVYYKAVRVGSKSFFGRMALKLDYKKYGIFGNIKMPPPLKPGENGYAGEPDNPGVGGHVLNTVDRARNGARNVGRHIRRGARRISRGVRNLFSRRRRRRRRRW